MRLVWLGATGLSMGDQVKLGPASIISPGHRFSFNRGPNVICPIFSHLCLVFFLVLPLPPSLSLYSSPPLKKKMKPIFQSRQEKKLLLIINRFLKRASSFPAPPRDWGLNGCVELGRKCQWGFDNDRRYSSLLCCLVKRDVALPPLCC